MIKIFIDNFYENATAMDWSFDGEVLCFSPLGDHERFSSNFQASCWNFRIVAPKDSIGRSISIRLQEVPSCWNGNIISSFDIEKLTTVVSRDLGNSWNTVVMNDCNTADGCKEFNLRLDSSVIQIAKMVPYTVTDLNKMFTLTASNPDCSIEVIGHSVDGRPLELMTIGNAPNTVFLRGRAHSWESGGSWLIQGLVNFLSSDSSKARQVLQKVSFCIMPMAAKDGVYRGMTRFTVNGFDLNRNWGISEEPPPDICPENACLLKWFEKQSKICSLPRLAICLHNDAEGELHLSHPDDNGAYRKRMQIFEQSLQKNTWFAEGIKPSSFRNPGTFGEGIMERFSVDALVWELNANYAIGLKRPPLHHDWMQLGQDFAVAVYEYLQTIDLNCS